MDFLMSQMKYLFGDSSISLKEWTMFRDMLNDKIMDLTLQSRLIADNTKLKETYTGAYIKCNLGLQYEPDDFTYWFIHMDGVGILCSIFYYKVRSFTISAYPRYTSDQLRFNPDQAFENLNDESKKVFKQLFDMVLYKYVPDIDIAFIEFAKLVKVTDAIVKL